MDSNKDFIHIDELFSKLKDPIGDNYRSEEAWVKMKGLLDEEMPAPPLGNTIGKRRYFYPLLALLLGIGSVATGYTILSDNAANKSLTNSKVWNAHKPITQNKHAAKSIATPTIDKSIANTPVDVAQVAKDEPVVSNTTPQVSAKISATHQNTGNKLANQAQQDASEEVTPRHQQALKAPDNLAQMSEATMDVNQNEPKAAAPERRALQNNKVNTNNTKSLSTIEKTPLEAPNNNMAANTSNSINNAITSNNVNTPNNHIRFASSTTEKKNAPINTLIKPTNNNTTLNNSINNNNSGPAIEPTTTLAKNDNDIDTKNKPIKTLQTVVKDDRIFVKQEDGNWYEEKTVPVRVVNKKEVLLDRSTNTYATIVESDNTSLIEKLVKVEDNIAANLEANTAAESAAAASNSAASTYTDLKSLSDTKVKSFGTEANSNSFFKNYILRDDVLKFFNKPNDFEAMLTFGGLYSPAATGSYGFNFGVGIIYNITERLNVGVEAKYSRKIFSNFYQEDAETHYDVTQNGSLFSGTKYHASHEYTIRNYNSFEFPLYIRYNIGDRLSLMAGIQYVYAAPIKWSVQTSETIDVNFNSIERPHNYQPVINQNTDFNERNGFGYMVGLGFDASKRINVDFRVSQNFYNKRYQSPNVINSIYTAPVFTLTFGYCFGKKDKIYYLMKQ